MDLSSANSVAGFVSLVNSLIVVPSLVALRKIVSRHDDEIEDVKGRVDDLEHARRFRRQRRRK